MNEILPCIPMYLYSWRIWNSAYRPPRSATISSNLELFILSEIPSSVFHSSAQHPEVAPEVEVEREFPAQFNTRINIHRGEVGRLKKRYTIESPTSVLVSEHLQVTLNREKNKYGGGVVRKIFVNSLLHDHCYYHLSFTYAITTTNTGCYNVILL